MNHPRRICLILFLSSTTFVTASNTPTSIVPDNIVLCQSKSGCFNKILFGRSYEVLSTPRFTVMASISREGEYMRADVSIFNNSRLPLNLAPDDFRIEVVSPKARILTYISPADLKDIPPSPAIPPLPDENTGATATSSSAHMLAVSSTQTPGIDELYAAAKRREALRESYDKAVAQQHLVASTIAPGETVRGRVYFERDKHAEAINLVLPVAGLVFDFPFQVKR
jgi:hypothetical protein